MTRGPVKPEPGLVSRQGLALLDDSDSLILNPDGMPAPRQGKGKDLYYFAYGENYREAVNDFYDISGRPPLPATPSVFGGAALRPTAKTNI